MELRLGIHQRWPPILDVSSQSPCDWLLLVVNKQHNNTLLSQGHLLPFESPGVRGHHLRMLQISQMSIATYIHVQLYTQYRTYGLRSSLFRAY